MWCKDDEQGNNLLHTHEVHPIIAVVQYRVTRNFIIDFHSWEKEKSHNTTFKMIYAYILHCKQEKVDTIVRLRYIRYRGVWPWNIVSGWKQ